MNELYAHLVQPREKVLGDIDGLFEAVQPVVGGTHPSNSEREQRETERNELEKACNDEDTASL